ncbi:hypothetical protein A4X09_0g3490 [Tilletia walkeri]|uniref:Mediator of RNA polymerase II transcription subunit 13 n=1 Tax=Tilletia walkeri TaxID=117179 RepID=A0A8X7T622_9BASI|nr:hypothetical protein A4X09_0g3490 [Tilletia walkeri]
MPPASMLSSQYGPGGNINTSAGASSSSSAGIPGAGAPGSGVGSSSIHHQFNLNAQPRLPHAPAHTAHTLTNIVRLPWTCAASDRGAGSNVGASTSAISDASPSASQTLYTAGGPSIATPRLGSAFSPGNASSTQVSVAPAIGFSWRRYEFKLENESDPSAATPGSGGQRATQGPKSTNDRRADRQLVKLRNLLTRCASLEANRTLGGGTDAAPPFSDNDFHALHAGEYLRDRLLYAFEAPPPESANTANTSAQAAEHALNPPSHAAASSASSASKPGRKRKRESTANPAQPEARESASTDETATSQTSTPSKALAALWIFEAAPISQLRSSHSKVRDPKGKGKARATDDTPFTLDPLGSAPGDDLIFALRKEILQILAADFDMTASGILNPSASLFPSLRPDSLASPAMLQPSRRHHIAHGLLVRALHERLLIDFVRAHGWDGRPISGATSQDEQGQAEQADEDQPKNEPEITQSTGATQGTATVNVGGTAGRPRSATIQSISEEGEIPEVEEGEHPEDGEIEEGEASEPVADEVEQDEPVFEKRSRIQLPPRRRGLASPQTRPVRFGSLILLLPCGVGSVAPSSADVVLCIRFRASVGPEALVLTVSPTYLWLRQLGTGICQQIDTLDDSESIAETDDSGRANNQGEKGTRILLAPMGFADLAQERRWMRFCMPGPENVFSDEPADVGHKDMVSTGRSIELVGALSAQLNALVAVSRPGTFFSGLGEGGGPLGKASASSDGAEGEGETGNETSESEAGWWVPEPLRTRLENEGIDLATLGCEPRWAVVRTAPTDERSGSEVLAQDPKDEEPGDVTISTGEIPQQLATPRAGLDTKSEAEGDGQTAASEGPLDVQGKFGKNAFLWPLPLCFLHPLPDSTTPIDTERAKQTIVPDQLPFSDVRGAPIYPPYKSLTCVNVADVLDQSAHMTNVQAVFSATQAPSLSPIAFNTGSQAVPRPNGLVSAEKVGGASDDAAKDTQDDWGYGLPTRDFRARQNLAISAEQATNIHSDFMRVEQSDAQVPATSAGVVATTSVPMQPEEDIWNSVLGVSNAGGGFKPSGNATAPHAHQMVPNGGLMSGVHNGTVQRRDLDGFDAMDLVTEDDFSFFDNVNAFDFGGLDGTDTMGTGVIPLQGSAAPFLDAVNLVPEPAVTMESLLGPGMARAVPNASVMMMLSEGDGHPTQTGVPMSGPISADTGPSQTATEHPSLPGFTPSSFSVSSPAFGLNGQAISKTPRTPFSPMEDVVDQSVSVHAGNGYPTLRQHLAAIEVHSSGVDMDNNPVVPSSGQPLRMNDSFVTAFEKDADEHDPQFLHSKYDSGKFAIPEIVTSPAQAGAPVSKDGASAQMPLVPRTPTRHRFRFITRRGMKGTLHGTPSKRKVAEDANWISSRPGTLSLALAHLRDGTRGDEEISDIGTLETYSDSGASDDTLEESDGQDEEESLLSQTKDTLKRLIYGTDRVLDSLAAHALQQAPYSPPTHTSTLPVQSKADSKDALQQTPVDEESEQEEQWRRTVLECIALNPPLRAQALAEQSNSMTLPPVAAHETGAILERFSAALAGPQMDMSSLLLQALLHPSTTSDANGLDVPSAPSNSGGTLMESDGGVDVLESPYIIAGCQGYATRMAPAALKFWDKLGLSAVGGPKHVAPFILQLDASEYLLNSAVKWLERIDLIFQMHGLGSHVPNNHSVLRLGDGSAIDIAEVLGSMAIDTAQQECWEDTMGSIFDTLKTHANNASHIIIYIVGTPAWPIRWQGLTRMREDLTSMARQRLGTQGWQLQVRGVPQMMIFEHGVGPLGAGHRVSFDLKRFAFAIYDSLQRAVPHTTGKSLVAMGPRGQGHDQDLDLVQYPAFTLAPLFQRHMMDISLRWPLSSRDVVDRGLLLHVGYELRAAHDCVVMTVMDQRGQSFFTDAWKTKQVLVEDLAVIWLKTVQFARRADVAWRFVICKSSSMSFEEVLAWSSLERCGMFRGPGILDVTLGCVDTDSPLSLLPTADAPSGLASGPAAPNAVMLDGSSFNYALYPPQRLFVSPPVFVSHYPASHQLRPSSSTSTQSRPNPLIHNHDDILALASSATVRIPRQTDYSTASTGTFSTHVFSVPVHRVAPHVLWFHILQVYSKDSHHHHHSSSTDGGARSGPAARPSGHHAHLSKSGGGGTAGSTNADFGGFNPFLSAQAALHGRMSSKLGSHFGSDARLGSSPLSAGMVHSASANTDYPTVSSTGVGPVYASSPSLTASAAATAANAAADASVRAALRTRLRDITQSMHELQFLSMERYALAEPACFLPAHLGLLAVSAPGLASYVPMTAGRPDSECSDE